MKSLPKRITLQYSFSLPSIFTQFYYLDRPTHRKYVSTATIPSFFGERILFDFSSTSYLDILYAIMYRLHNYAISIKQIKIDNLPPIFHLRLQLDHCDFAITVTNQNEIRILSHLSLHN